LALQTVQTTNQLIMHLLYVVYVLDHFKRFNVDEDVSPTCAVALAIVLLKDCIPHWVHELK